VEVEGSLLLRWVALYARVSAWMREERRKHTRALARLTERVMAGRGARAHDVRMNNPPKSGPKPRRPAISFCRLVLL
jgi:hypothetical protein